MSYEIAVFDPKSAPQDDDDAFVAWYAAQAAVSDEPREGTVALRNWFSDFSEDFPAVNGPYADADDGDTRYAFGRTLTRADCPDALGAKAAETGRNLAGKHGVGFYNPNAGDQRLFFP